MHNSTTNPLLSFVSAGLGTSERPESPGAVRENERNEVLQARAASVQNWRECASSPDREVSEQLDGAALRKLREACKLDVGFVSEVANVSPNIIEAAERGQATFADAELCRVAAAMRDALAAERA